MTARAAPITSAPVAGAERSQLPGDADLALRLQQAARSAHERASRMRAEAGRLDDRMRPLRRALCRRACELDLQDFVLEQVATGVAATATAPQH